MIQYPKTLSPSAKTLTLRMSGLWKRNAGIWDPNVRPRVTVLRPSLITCICDSATCPHSTIYTRLERSAAGRIDHAAIDFMCRFFILLALSTIQHVRWRILTEILRMLVLMIKH